MHMPDTAKIYREGRLQETNFSYMTKPLILIGSGKRFGQNTPICENAAKALEKEGITYARYYGDWPKDEWIFLNGVYFPSQQVAFNEAQLGYVLGEGGMTVTGKDFCILSERSVYGEKRLEPVVREEIKKAAKIKNVYFAPFMSHPHIDLTIGYIPWERLFIFDELYFRMNSGMLESIVAETGSDMILTTELYAPNIFVYGSDTSYGEERFVMTYAAPKTSQKLRKRGIRVIEPEGASPEHFACHGGISCAMNTVISPSLLPVINKGRPEEYKRVYPNNPHL